MPTPLFQFLNLVIYLLIILIFVEVVLSNFIAFGRGVSPYNPLVRTVRSIVNPILEPFRRLLPPARTGGWDFSPMIVLLLLYLLRNFLTRMQ